MNAHFINMTDDSWLPDVNIMITTVNVITSILFSISLSSTAAALALSFYHKGEKEREEGMQMPTDMKLFIVEVGEGDRYSMLCDNSNFEMKLKVKLSPSDAV
jgi:hypothetical protein